MLKSKPLRIVQRIPGPGTCAGAGDTIVDENGGHWRVLHDFEEPSASSTIIETRRTIRDGKLW